MTYKVHACYWFGLRKRSGNVTAAGWKLGRVQEEDEGHHQTDGEEGFAEKPSAVRRVEASMFMDFIKNDSYDYETQYHVNRLYENSSHKVTDNEH